MVRTDVAEQGIRVCTPGDFMSRNLRSAVAKNRARQAEITAALETSRIQIKAAFLADDPNREPLIGRILAASRKPCAPIVACKQLLGSDGNWYSCHGFPIGVNMTEPSQLRIIGYAYEDPINGTTYGTRQPDAETLRAKWEARQDSDASELRAFLLSACVEQFASQIAYWLKNEL